MKNKTLIKVLFITLSVLVVVSGVLIYFAFNKYQEIKTDPAKIFEEEKASQESNVSVEVSSPSTTATSVASQSQAPQKIITVKGKQYAEKPEMLNILFCGIDYMQARADRNLGERSDMIMICAIDMKNYTAKLISIPRDTYTTVYKVNDNGKVDGKETTRINAAFAYGHGRDKYSFQNTIRTVEHFMNIEDGFKLDIRYYAGIDIDGIAKIASALDGVTVKLEEYFPGIGKEGDTVTLKGSKAMDYVRERKKVGGDLSRTRRQQVFMMAIAKKMQKLGAMQTASKLFDKLSSTITTNFNIDEVMALAMILDKMQISKIEHITVDGASNSKLGASYYFADENSIRKIMLDTYYTPVE